MDFIRKALRSMVGTAAREPVEATRPKTVTRRDVLMLMANDKLTPAQARALMRKL